MTTIPAGLRTGGQILVAQLVAQKVDRVTCVPGESYLAVLDALYDSAIDTIVCRNEGGAAMMADAYGKLTGRPGVCFVTRGPGATNACHGVHIAMQDSTPLILFVGQVATDAREREAFQEIDYRAMFGSLCKWVVEIDRCERIPELVARAFRVALQGRPGPVVVSLPEDMLTRVAEVGDSPFVRPAAASPAPAAMEELAFALAAAQQPLAIVGGSGWTAAAVQQMADFSLRSGIPVATSFRRASLFSADHPYYAGDLGIGPNPRLAKRVRDADLVLLVGGRFSEMPSASYTMMDIPKPRQRLIHVHAGAEEIGRVYQPDIAVQASPAAFAAALDDLDIPAGLSFHAQGDEAHADYLDWSSAPRKLPGDFQFGEVVSWLSERLPADAIVCNGAGNYAGWVHRYHRFRQFGRQLAPTSGSMGYGIPAAVMAKRHHPDQIVLAYAGDGCFLMNGQEFATAVQYECPIIVIVADNGQYGTIRAHQEREYPGRVAATQLRNPDFAGYARTFGGHGETVLFTEEFAPAFERALKSGKPSILHCKLDPRAQSHLKDFVPAAEAGG